MSVQPNEDRPLASIETALDELERVVKELEAGQLPLERALELFEKGVALGQTCRAQLQEAETRVEILLKRNGMIQPEPLRPDKE